MCERTHIYIYKFCTWLRHCVFRLLRSNEERITGQTLTIVVGVRQDRGEVAVAVLGDYVEAGEGALLAGDVERRVTAVVC